MQVQQLHRACGDAPAEAEVLVFADGKLRDLNATRLGPNALIIEAAAIAKPEEAAPPAKIEQLSALKPLRTIDSHKVNVVNEAIELDVLDGPGSGGASHLYRIKVANKTTIIAFQNGPIAEAGVNGLTQEVLLAIVVDRLESFQRGPFKCKDNEDALQMIKGGMTCLKKRTLRRLEQGVEGTHAQHVESPSSATHTVAGMDIAAPGSTDKTGVVPLPTGESPEAVAAARQEKAILASEAEVDTASTPPPAENPVTEPTPAADVPAPAQDEPPAPNGSGIPQTDKP